MTAKLSALGLMLLSVASVRGQDRVSCSSCTIQTQVVATLGTRDGPAALPGSPAAVTVDSKGRFWMLVSGRAPLLFSGEGNFLQEVGRIGQGPGEFQLPNKLAAAGDSIVVFDALGAVTVIGPNLEHVRNTSQSAVSQPRSVAVVEWPNLVLVAGLSRRQSNAVWPLHFVHLGGATPQTLQSFGENSGVATPETSERLIAGYPAPEQKLARLVTAAGPDAIFAVTRFTEYVLTKWDRTGTATWQLRLESSWFPKKDTWRLGSSNVAPDAKMQAIWYDSRRYVWTYAHVAAPDWQQARRTFLQQNPQTPPPPGSGRAVRSAPAGSSIPERSLYRTMIEVIDVQSRALVARTHFPGFVLHTLPDGRFVSYREDADGIPYVDIVAALLVTSG